MASVKNYDHDIENFVIAFHLPYKLKRQE